MGEGSVEVSDLNIETVCCCSWSAKGWCVSCIQRSGRCGDTPDAYISTCNSKTDVRILKSRVHRKSGSIVGLKNLNFIVNGPSDDNSILVGDGI